MSAPSSRRRGIPAGKDRLWVNPCGFEEHDMPDLHLAEVGQLSDIEILSNIILQAGNALDSVEGFKHEYVRETFQEEFMKHHNSWKDQRYDWLPKFQVPKSLGIKVHPDHLQNIELDEFLRDAYRYLQIMAVALEQVAWDQDDPDHANNPDFLSKFRDVEFKLRAVLCEIQNAMIERHVKPHPDVDREIMKDEFRYVKDNTSRNLRDWIIFRDYMIVLEYVREVFQHFLNNPSRITPS